MKDLRAIVSRLAGELVDAIERAHSSGIEHVDIRRAPLSARVLRRMIAAGEIRGFRVGRTTLVRADDLRGLIEKRPIGLRAASTELEEQPACAPSLRARLGLVEPSPRRAPGGSR